MRRRIRGSIALALAAIAFAPMAGVHEGVGPAMLGAQDVRIVEWRVPWENSRPRDPYVAPDGGVWFVGQTADYAARLDPADGSFERFDLPSGAGPHNLIVDDDGIVWYAGNRAAHIGRIDPSTGEITRYPMPDARASDPHTLVFDSRGLIWFTVQHGNMIGRLDPQTGAVSEVLLPGGNGSRPYGMAVDEADRIWLVETGVRPNRFVGYDTRTSVFTGPADIPSGAGSVRHMYYDAESREVWFGADANTVGRARLP